MIEVSNLVTPSPEWWEVAIRGMRNPFKATEKSDSYWCSGKEKTDCKQCDFYNNSPELAERYCSDMNGGFNPPNAGFVLGKEDKKRLISLCKAGNPSHRKVLRQLPVIMDIKAPLFFWKQLDQYKVGTCTNSESTMHTLTKKEFELSDFSTEQEYLNKSGWLSIDTYNFPDDLITLLNNLREKYLETGDIEYWYKINEFLPQSYMQLRTWSANYEVLVNIIIQRIHHKLPQCRALIIYWLRNIPYLLDIIEALEVVKRTEEAVYISDTNEQLYQFAA